MDFEWDEAKRGTVVRTGKERITIRLDADIVQWFRDQVKSGGNYQTLMNEALRAHIRRQEGEEPLETLLRRVLREELHPTG